MAGIRVFLAALVSASILVAACNGDDSGAGAPTVVRTITVTPAPTIAPRPTSTPDPGGVIREDVDPLPAATVGRSDCPETWVAYQDEQLSVCFPSDHFADRYSSAAARATVFLVIRLIPGEPVAHTPSTISLSSRDTYTPPATCELDLESVDPSAQTSLDAYQPSDLVGVSCTAIASYATLFKGQLDVPGGAIQFRAYAVEPEELDLAKEILATVRAVQ